MSSRSIAVSLVCVVAGGAGGCTRSGVAGFASPEDGADALVAALRADDAPGLRRLFGEDADGVIFSGDAVADRFGREDFVAAYDQRHEVTMSEDATTAVIVVGENDWAMPIPLVRDGEGDKPWRFDEARGRDEITARRIGSNELDAIETCRAIADAQQEYFVRTGMYARKFMSDPGEHNGLYWPSEPREPESPLGPMLAGAAREGYPDADAAPESGPAPYHGYCFGLLTAQGRCAPGGERCYLVDECLRDGFAVIAYPVEYGNSGIMTFIVSQSGFVYERDLGPKTAETARSMPAFDPDLDWHVVPDAPPTSDAPVP